MTLEEEPFYYLKEHVKMASIDIGATSVKFILVRKGLQEYNFQYEIEDVNLYALDNYESAFTDTAQRMSDITHMLGILRNTPVYVSFSYDTHILSETEAAGEPYHNKGAWFVMPFQVKKDFMSNDQELIYAATPRKKIADILALFKHCNIPVSGFSLSPLALAHSAAAVLSEDDWYNTTAIVDIGAQETLCCVSAGYYTFALKRFSYGGNQLAAIVGKHLGKDSIELASYDRVAKGELKEVIQLAMEAFFEEIRDYFTQIMAEKSVPPGKLILSGGTARLHRIASYMSHALGIPTMLWGIRGSIHLRHSITGKKQFLYDEPALGVGMGMLSKTVPMCTHLP